MAVVLGRKSRHDITLMRKAGQIVAEVHALVKEALRPGVTTLQLDEMAEAHIRKSGGLPTFKGYHGFPATLCTSINDEVVHGIPSAERILHEGDVISVDTGCTYKGLIADSAFTAGIGAIDPKVQALLDATRESLYAAIAIMKPGAYLEDIGGAVEDTCAKYGYGLVKQYGGHSVGHKLHEPPFVPNYRTGERGPELKSGATIAVEPMFNLGTEAVYTADDDWTVLTEDHQPSAHFEHTILITEDGSEPLTEMLGTPVW
ncbi:MAG: type I methionyl aminopeptidase [Vampirovibrionales bacterium]|nr:type I methionyl aminopeptidase [Vampirovibrionales bacterium]